MQPLTQFCQQYRFYHKTTYCFIQGVSRFVDITAGGDLLGLCDQKFHINM